MARAALAVNTITRSGVVMVAETTGDPTNNHSVANTNGDVMLLVHNSNGASTARVVTIHVAATVDGFAVTSRTISVAAAATVLAGKFNVDQYGTTLLVDVDNAELKLAAYRFA